MNRHFFVILKMVVRWWSDGDDAHRSQGCYRGRCQAEMRVWWDWDGLGSRSTTGLAQDEFLSAVSCSSLGHLLVLRKADAVLKQQFMADRIGRQMQQVLSGGSHFLSWTSCRWLDKQWGFALEEGQPFTAPVWMGEFGYLTLGSLGRALSHGSSLKLRVAIPHQWPPGEQHQLLCSHGACFFSWSVPIHLCNPLQLESASW